MLQFTSDGHVTHQRHGFFSDTKTEVRIAGSKTRHAQHAQRIFAKGKRNMAQQTVFQIVASVIRVDNLPVVIAGHCVDGQVTTLKIGLQRDICGGIAGESGVPRA